MAWAKRWTHIWLETDSSLVVNYFRNPLIVPWRLQTIWNNSIFLARQMHIRVTHIYREGNTVVDGLANYGACHDGSRWWDELPVFIAAQYGRDLSSATVHRFR